LRLALQDRVHHLAPQAEKPRDGRGGLAFAVQLDDMPLLLDPDFDPGPRVATAPRTPFCFRVAAGFDARPLA